MWTLWVISGYLRLSPRYLPAIFTIDANLVPAISGYLPLSSPTDGFFPGYLRLSPAIFTYLWILYRYLRLSPAISRLSSRYLQVFVSFFARVFSCDGFHFSAWDAVCWYGKSAVIANFRLSKCVQVNARAFCRPWRRFPVIQAPRWPSRTRPSWPTERRHWSAQKCGSSTKVSDGAVPKAAGQVYCKWCANIYQMLYRHLGGLPQTLSTMTASEQKEFWKKSSELIQATPRNGRWSLVRSSLVSEMCRFKKEVNHPPRSKGVQALVGLGRWRLRRPPPAGERWEGGEPSACAELFVFGRGYTPQLIWHAAVCPLDLIWCTELFWFGGRVSSQLI